MSGPACHVCGAAEIKEFPEYGEFRRVTSDCKPWPAGGRLAVCEPCGCAQAILDGKWRDEARAIYDAYAIYHTSGGVEQSVFDQASGQATSRSARLLQRLMAGTDLPDKGRLLDIGCGNGALLRAFSGMQSCWSLAGVEVNDRYRTAVENIPGVERLYVGAPTDVPGCFDLITLMHALEHIPSPRDYIAGLLDKLEPGGRLLIQVPDCRINPFMFLVADHASHFFVTTLQAMVQDAGYSVVAAADDWVAKEITVVAQKPGERTGSDESVKGARRPADEYRDRSSRREEAHSEIRNPKSEIRNRQSLVTSAATVQGVNKRLAWLSDQADFCRTLASGGRFGLFGTSIAATWLLAELGEAVRFFVDEDPHRVGRTAFERPIYDPQHVPEGSDVYLALPPIMAAHVKARLDGTVGNVRFHLPSSLSEG